MPVNVEMFHVADFQQALDRVADDQNLVLKENGFEAKGRLGAFFTGKTAHRNAAEALYHAVKAQYGQTVADTLAPQLRDSMIKGKPLSARTVRTALADAQEFRQAIYDANAEAVHAFVNRNTAPGDSRNLGAALAPFFAELGLNGAEQAVLEGQALQSIADKAARGDKLLSFEDFKNIGLSTALSVMQEIYADRLSAQHGLDAEQAAQMRELVQLASAQARVAAPGRAPLSPGQICLAAERGELPGQQALLFAMGKVEHPDAGVRDTMLLTTAANRVDMALFCENNRIGGLMGMNMRFMEMLPEMRQAQPEGPLSRETVWKFCLGEDMPAQMAAEDQKDFNTALSNKLMEQFCALKPGDPMAGYNGLMNLALGISTEKSAQAVTGAITLSLEDFVASHSLYPLRSLPDMDGCEHQLARDINRRGSQQGIEGFSPVISFGAPGQPVQSVNIQDTAGLSEAEQAAFRDGKPSPISASLVQHCRELCGGSEVQARVLIMGMTQAGTMTTRSLSPVAHLGGILEEHSPHHMDALRNEDGSVTLRIYTPSDSPLDADYTFTIQPDGQNRLTAFRMQAATGSPVDEVQRAPRFSAMPERSRQALISSIETVMAHTPQAGRQSAVERLKNDFFGIMPETYDISTGMQRFKDENLIDGFLQPIQQGFVRDNGMHDSFHLDAVRGSIGHIGGIPMPPNQSRQFYEDALRQIIPEQHHRFLPFVSMMASQAGLDCAPAFLPFLSGAEDSHLMEAQMGPAYGADHVLNLFPVENGLRIEHSFSQPYKAIDAPLDEEPSLIQKGRVTMVIDFSAEPAVHEVQIERRDEIVGQRTVYVPQVTLENGDLHFETPLV